MNAYLLFDLAQLAEAAYANLVPENDVAAALKSGANNMHFSVSQASDFVTQWSVLHHLPDTVSGFSATLFESKDRPGQIVLACRGTAGLVDDALLTDVGDIVLDGIALGQVVDLYNYWKSLTSEGVYQAARWVTLQTETQALKDAYLSPSPSAAAQLEAQYRAQGLIVDYGEGPAVRSIEFGASDVFLSGTELALGSGAAIGKTVVAATGHSLGGHLAAAFARLFPELNVDVLAVNGAGFADNSNVDNLFALLGGAAAFDSSGLLNVYGSAGPQVIAQDWYLQQQGGYEEIKTETARLSTTFFGHGKEQMTDSLAVYDLFFRMDGALGSGLLGAALDTLRPLFEAAAPDAERTLESLVGSLGRLFGALTNDPKTGDREALYAGLKSIREAAGIGDGGNRIGLYQIESLTIKSANDLTLAATNPDPASTSAIAYRYALKALNPFAVVGADYSAHNQNGELDLYDAQTRTGRLTESWLVDRAAFLAWKNRAYLKDIGQNTTVGDADTPAQLFSDLFASIRVFTSSGIEGVALPAENPRRFVFGGDNTDAAIGGNQADRLYGGGGADLMEGRAGDDYLEGGAGRDVYQYNASEAGINSNDGADTILDTDGRGILRYTYDGGSLISSDITDTVIADASLKLGENQWQSADGRFSYTKQGADLLGSFADMAGGSLLLKDWREGDFFIRLEQAFRQVREYRVPERPLLVGDYGFWSFAEAVDGRVS